MSGALASIATSLLQAADLAYEQREWRTARDFYRRVASLDPQMAPALALPVAIGHCEIELAPDDALDAVAPPAPPLPGGDRLGVLTSRLRYRARHLCQAGAHARAARVLRFLAHYDAPIADTYRRSIDAGPTPSGGFAGSTSGAPPVLAAEGLTDAHIAPARRWADGKRLLLVYRQLFFHVPERCHEPVDLFRRSAERFGFTVRHLNSHAAATPDADPMALAVALQAAIAEFRPDLIIVDELFATGLSAGDPALAARLEAVLAAARRNGVKVVNYFLDVWRVPPPIAFRGLGEAIDLVGHCHPAMLGRGTPAQNEAVFCYMLPIFLPAPAVARGSIARACFVGSVYESAIGRLVWWAETGRRGVPFDFLETDHGAAALRSDQAFADLFHAYRLSVNFTRRPSGATILTGRTLQALVSGGALLEEDSIDSAYFLTPGEHYVPFVSLDDLTAAIDRLLGDGPACVRLADAGHRFATRHYTGDWFWTGLIRRLGA